MKFEKIVMNEANHVSLTCYIQDVGGEYGFAKRPAIIVIPGGGYSMCSDREADPVATAYLRAGYHAFVLRYTLRDKGVWPAPLNDYEEAYEIIEKNSDEWGVAMDHIAVVGFSAGGHLAAFIATMAKHRPQAAILGYPAILREILDACAPGLPSPAEHVDGNTCPCFIFATRTDEAVSMYNELAMEKALADHGIIYESHIYAFGPHGFGSAEEWLEDNICPRARNWVDDSLGFLSEMMGKLTRTGFEPPKYPGKVNEDDGEYLSVYCTFGHLLKQGNETAVVISPVLQAIDALAENRGLPKDILYVVISGTTLQQLMKTLLMPETVMQEISARLKEIPNKKESD